MLIASNPVLLRVLLFSRKRFLQKVLFDLPLIITSWCSPPAPRGLLLAVRGRRRDSTRTFQVLQAPIYQDKIIHYLIRWDMSPCACASVSVRGGEKCGNKGGEHEKEPASDVRRFNEAWRPRRSKLEGETAPFA